MCLIREENTVHNDETTKQNFVISSWLEHCKVAMGSSEGKQEYQWNGIASREWGCSIAIK